MESRHFARNGREKRGRHIGRSFCNPETQNSTVIIQQESRVDLPPFFGKNMTEIVPIESIGTKIIFLRDEKVLLDRDLAVI